MRRLLLYATMALTATLTASLTACGDPTRPAAPVCDTMIVRLPSPGRSVWAPLADTIVHCGGAPS